VGTHAIGAERLSAVGKGDSEPLNTGNPAAPENRRVTLVTRVAN
jgi:flagellar motor protein MotB